MLSPVLVRESHSTARINDCVVCRVGVKYNESSTPITDVSSTSRPPYSTIFAPGRPRRIVGYRDPGARYIVGPLSKVSTVGGGGLPLSGGKSRFSCVFRTIFH